MAALAVVGVGAALRAGRVVFIPLSFSLFLAVLVWPAHRWLERRMARWGALVVVSAGLVAVAASAAGAMLWIGARAARQVSASSARLGEAAGRVRGWLEAQGLPAGWVPTFVEGGAEADAAGGWHGLPPEMLDRAGSFATGGFGTALEVAGAVALTLLLAVMALAESAHWRGRAERVLGPARATRVEEAFEEASRQFRRYAAATTLTGLLAGTLTAGVCWAAGVPMALLWGVLAWLFNYIPNVGVFFSAIPPVALAFVEGGVGTGLAVLGGLAVVETVTANIVAPVLEGRAVRLSPLTVMVALLVWGYLWGGPGALLAVPMTTTLVLVMRRVEGTRMAAELLVSSRHGGDRG